MSLVADYSDSSETEISSTESDLEESKPYTKPQSAKSLTSANVALANAAAKKTGDVFSNPFLEAELNKTASLERHVKMVKNDTHILQKNGRKICWNYRKGRCRFGTSCQFAHDSDLSDLRTTDLRAPESSAPKSSARNVSNDGNRKRPGLGNSIEPSKRVMKSYQSQQTQVRRDPL